eukprot:CAMPEP_0174850116 /NCGR_PEP_ID=MMETSP1114-20130205/19053_1 /TAXON_ID=312471 /ORGANISM="Neobodo designis, Strain CCAP 1951/1" /LENGTH=214 /DNA_ID=CAMNT_0016084551 /DNA_START=40 /DNA_END=684 /DNA_ORIENTATION=-
MGCTESKELTAERIVEGLKAALDLAVRETVNQLGSAGGFNDNPALHIKIPDTLGDVMDKVKPLPGIGDKVNEFESKMNEAAEAAAGSCAEIFSNALGQLNFSDAKAILEGADDAATKIFREVLGGELLAKFAPIVREKMGELGVVSVFETITDAFASIPLIGKKVEFDLYDYVCNKAFEGFFSVLAEFEGKVRNTPAMRQNNQVLQEVFGSKKK